MILYHGTNIDIQSIDLEQCMPYKDFGRGFYLTDLEQQAKDMALRKAKFSPILHTFLNTNLMKKH